MAPGSWKFGLRINVICCFLSSRQSVVFYFIAAPAGMFVCCLFVAAGLILGVKAFKASNSDTVTGFAGGFIQFHFQFSLQIPSITDEAGW